jgi:hypothetical protein
MHEEEIECMEDFGGETRRKETTMNTLKFISEKQDEVAWTGLIWLRTGTSDRLF